MKTTIFYFTGTGNSLQVARDLAMELGGAEVISIPKAMETGAGYDADCVGIVFPVYMFGMPLIVAEFARKLTAKAGAYIFAVATYAGIPGATLVHLKKLLESRGMKLAAGFGVVMPGNYTPLYGAPSQRAQEKIFSKAKMKVKEIAEVVKARKSVKPVAGNFVMNLILWDPIYRWGSSYIHESDKYFRAGEKCNSCGICGKVCPVSNIEMQGGKPVWGHNCQQCMACLQWCPREAIQMGRTTEGRKRYRHPAIRIDDMMVEQ